MELWNSRNLSAPPTYTYEAASDEIDIEHLRTILQDGLNFFKDQYLMKLETTLLSRITYRMKRKFRSSKDYQSLEKVKKDLLIFSQIDIETKLQHLLSIVPLNYSKDTVFLPTKNMIDFILVRLQGIGKILCRVIEMCKLTMEYYECRLCLGHFWRMALVAVALISRINILSLNIIKFTCLLYIRLLPFSNKLKNSGVDWLPKDYVFPKDLKEWLNIEWSKFDEIIEIPENDYEIPLFDLVEDSDDDVEFCNEYINVDEDDDEIEIVSEFKKLNKKINKIDFDKTVTILRGFATDHIDSGEVLSSEESEDEDEDSEGVTTANGVIITDKNKITTSSEIGKRKFSSFAITSHQTLPQQEVDIGEIISSDDDQAELPEELDKVGEMKSIFQEKNIYSKIKKRQEIVTTADRNILCKTKINTKEILSKVKEKLCEEDEIKSLPENATSFSTALQNVCEKHVASEMRTSDKDDDEISDESESDIEKIELNAQTTDFNPKIEMSEKINNINLIEEKETCYEIDENDTIPEILISSSDDDIEICTANEEKKMKSEWLTSDFIPLETNTMKNNADDKNTCKRKKNKRKIFNNSLEKKRKLSHEIENFCPNQSTHNQSYGKHKKHDKFVSEEMFQRRNVKLSNYKMKQSRENKINKEFSFSEALTDTPNVKKLKTNKTKMNKKMKNLKKNTNSSKNEHAFIVSDVPKTPSGKIRKIKNTPPSSRKKLKELFAMKNDEIEIKPKLTPKKNKRYNNLQKLGLTNSPQEKRQKNSRKNSKRNSQGTFDIIDTPVLSNDASKKCNELNYKSVKKENDIIHSSGKKRKFKNNVKSSFSPKKSKIKGFIVEQLRE